MGQTNAGQPTTLDFNTLPPYQERTFVPVDVDLTQKETVTALYDQLLQRSIQTSDELETLMQDRSELEAAFSQIHTILYIRMTCQTDDPARAQAYKDIIETVVPAIKPLADQLDRKIIEAVDGLEFKDPHYDVYFRKIRNDIELFRPENVPLQTDDALLSQQFQTVTGAMTVDFDGKENPIAKMRTFQMETDRDLRQRAWQATTDRYMQDAEKLNQIFDKMVSVRTQIAQNAGFENYRDYKFRESYRFDYTPDDCKGFHAAVEKYLVPVQRAIYSLRAEQMGLGQLRPWDLLADPLRQAPLKPFDSTADMIDGMSRMFGQLDDQFGQDFQVLIDHGLLDLDSRKGKAPGGYQTTLYEARKPFIFMNAIGTNDDLEALMHEGGHAFHAMACANETLMDYRYAPIEFGEVASMSMELLAATQLSVCYDQAQQKRWWRIQLESMVLRGLINVAIFDSFQHWIYENPTHTAAERNEKCIEINNRFGGGLIDWSGLEASRGVQWHRILHLFQCPLYYIEYGIAQLGAIGLWLQSQKDVSAAISNYKKALSLGGSQPLPKLFEAADLTFDFSEITIQPLAGILLEKWQQSTQD